MASKRLLWKLLEWLGGLLAGLFVVALGLALLSSFLLGVQFIIVLSGSMTPAMPAGSLAVVREVDPAQVAVGDVITYGHPADPQVLVTHRVVELRALEGGAPAFGTKGDANEEADSYLVPAESVTGKALFAIPYVGYTRDFIKTFAGFALLILLPGTLLITNEVVSLMRESNPRRKALTRRRRRRAY